MSFKTSGVARYVAVAAAGMVTLLSGAAIPFIIKKNVPAPTDAPVPFFQLVVSGATTALDSPRLNINTVGTLTASGHLVSRGLGANAFLRSTSSGMIAPALSTPVTLADANSYYVNDSGDSMTGALLIEVRANGAAATADAGIKLEVVGYLSGSLLFANDLLATSGAIRASGDITLNEDADAGNVLITFASDTTNETLTWLNLVDAWEFSDDIRTTGNLTASGTFKADGSLVTEGDLTLNEDQTAANTLLTFGSDSVNETLTFLNAADRFEFSDDLAATGNLTSSGTLKSDGSITTEGDFTLNEDQTAANTLITFGSDSVNETLNFLNATDRFEFSDDLNATGTYTGSGDAIIYGKILSKNTGGASGTLIINGGAISATPGDHITVRPEGAGLFRAPKDIIWSDVAGTADATGSGNSIAIPDSMSGGMLVDWSGNWTTAGVTGTATWQIINKTDGCDLFSTKITIDTAEISTSTAAAAAVINTACNTFTTDDVLILRTDVTQTTAGKGKAIRITIAPK